MMHYYHGIYEPLEVTLGSDLATGFGFAYDGHSPEDVIEFVSEKIFYLSRSNREEPTRVATRDLRTRPLGFHTSIMFYYNPASPLEK